MNTLEARFRVITPMFLGGADQKAEVVRPASVKGALRFWWRALHWSRCLEKANHHEVEALKHLHAEEARLFGISAAESVGGQGIFLLQVANQTIQFVDQPFKLPGQLYLLGQGLAPSTKATSGARNAIRENSEFTVKLIFRPGASPVEVAQIGDALLLFGLLGALGSRARHGLGSVAITSWTGMQKLPQSVDEYRLLVHSLLQKANCAEVPPFTAFSQKSRIDISAESNDALRLLNSVGEEQQMYRSYGRDGEVNRRPSEKNFTNDHDLIFDAAKGVRIERAPKRVVFGLPHNYHFSSIPGKDGNVEVNYAPKEGDSRRASPLFLHLHCVGEQFIAVHALLPAKFLPDGAQVRIKAARNTFSYVNPSPDWEVLRTYLNRFNGVVIHGAK